MLRVSDMSVVFGDITILDGVSFSLEKGEWLMIAGPNGAGKSTIVNAISGGVGYSGSVFVEGRDIARIKPAELARKIGVLAQQHFVSYAFTVEEVVRIGRYAYGGAFSGFSDKDEEMVAYALEKTGMTSMKEQSVLTLSGGELQRTFLAQVIAQNPKILMLDEPTNHLDIVYQKQIFALIKEWLRDGERAVLSVVHDLSLAKKYGDRALLLNHGRAVGFGEANEVLSKENLEAVYAIDVYGWMRDMLSVWDAVGEPRQALSGDV